MSLRAPWPGRTAPVLAALIAAAPAGAFQACSSDGTAVPSGLLERFISADCADCWTAPRTPQPAADAVAIDWIVPGRQGEDAPLAAAARREARQRLAALGRPPPEAFDARFAHPPATDGRAWHLRLSHGPSVNDYTGIRATVQPTPREATTLWLALVEELPAGTEGSPVPRMLVRNLFVSRWAPPARTAGLLTALTEQRAMQIPAGARPERLRLVGWLEDGRGRVLVIARSDCQAR